ncbi:MAG: DUF4982 domain-containing protein [Sedimentisphaerales bacterium]|nr:DUF4982 domain-containing protein [Sedimentisphaerales bacterium]
MKKADHSILCFFVACIVCASVSYADRSTASFHSHWRFAKGEIAGAEKVDFDDSAWEQVTVPHDWAIAGPFDPKENGYAGKLPWRGVGWYRKTFSLDKADQGKRVYLDFDGVMAFPRVYVNGQLAGQWDYGYMSFRVDATPFVKFGGANVIAVQADTRRHGTRWYPGAGIYRSVTMTICDPVHVAHWGTFVTTPQVNDSSATVQVSTTIENHLDAEAKIQVEAILFDPSGQPVVRARKDYTVPAKGSCQAEPSFEIPNPQRWDLDSPKLYTARVIISREDAILDTDLVTFGIRTFQFTANDGFHLNGRRVQLYGVNLHHDQGPLGAAFYTRAMERQLQIMKEMGCNALRTSHNPPAPEVLDLCDRMGIVVWDECFDKWNETSDRARDVDLVEHNKKQLWNFVLRDRNHPSVVLWSIGNEISDVESNAGGRGREQVKILGEFVRRLDPTRPVGMGCYIPSAVGTRVLESLDLTGWNYARRYAPFRELFPDTPIVYSESASALSTRGFYDLPLPNQKTRYSDRLQVDSYDLNAAPWSDIADAEFKLMEQDRFVAGEFVWTGFDYLGEPTPFDRDARSSYFGIVDLCGIPKDRFYLYRSYWRPDAVTVHILPHWNWPERVGKNVPVFIYTNGDSAELFLNGKSLGQRTKGELPDRPENFALGKPATAGTFQSDYGHPANHANDGDHNTRWCADSGQTDQWWQVDLGKIQPIRLVSIGFEKEEKNYGYVIKASSDASQWTTIATKQSSQEPRWGGPSEQFHDVDVQARYIRIEFTDLRSRVWASIREFGVFPAKVESSYYDPTYQYRLRWNEVVYEPGELKAVVYKDGEKIGEKTMRTVGRPASIRLAPDRTILTADGQDLCYVLVEALDEKGILCPLADNLVRFQVEGPAEIAGVGNGNPLSLEPFQADYRQLFYGKAMLILRTFESRPGFIRIAASGDGLRANSVKIRSE